MRVPVVLVSVLIVLGAVPRSAQAVPFGGVEFPQGAVSFADAVVSYSPVIIAGQPTPPYQNPANALGPPSGSDAICTDPTTCPYVVLGDGGTLTLRFIDNRLTGSGDATPDLWIFEVGDPERTFVEISKDGTTFTSVGTAGGGTSGIDIDAYGFGVSDQFAFVRLTDDASQVAPPDDWRGADIDAVGASSTVATPVPEPATLLLLATGLGMTIWRRTRRTSREGHGRGRWAAG